MSTVTISVKVKDYDQNGINVFELNGASKGKVVASAGDTIVFDQSDSSNVGHPLVIALYKDGHHNIEGNEYTIGVTKNGTPGQAGANTTFVLNDQTLNGTYYYYCQNHPGMGGTIHFGGTTIIDEGATADDAQDGDLTDKITKTILEYNPDTGFFDITVLSQTDPNTNPHANPWKAIGTDSTKFTRYKILYNVKDSSNVLAAQKVKTFNLITTNLDLPDEPELDEFLGNDPNNDPQGYEWRIYWTPSISRSPGGSYGDYRYMLLKYRQDAEESSYNYFSTYSSDRYRFWAWFPETNQFDSSDQHYAHSSYMGNRRFLNQQAIDLMFPFGVYKPMNAEPIPDVYWNNIDSHESLALRQGAIENYLDVDFQLYNAAGDAISKPWTAYTTFESHSASAGPDDTNYSFTWDGFDPDLWQYGSNMSVGFRNKNPNDYPYLEDFSITYDFWRSETLKDSGLYHELDLGFADFRYDDENPYVELDGYMYYRGPEKMSREDALAINPSVSSQYFNYSWLMGDNIFEEWGTNNEINRRFVWTIARKPLSPDHTMQTVADALKERRSYRTTNKVVAAPAGTRYLMDGSIKKFQSGEYYYPSNSPRYGSNFSNVTASAPFSVDGKTLDGDWFDGRFYAKDVVIGQT